METQKLYYDNPKQKEFTARVLECVEGKDSWQIVLDRTAFYPEGGGQPGDTGTLAGLRVLDTREKDGRLVHLCDGPLAVGQEVEGKLDWARRFDLMQQHTGEHMVSGILHRLYGANNVGFHMGWESITIDFDVEIPAAELPGIEALVNQEIWRCQPVRCWIPSQQELEGISYRSKRALPWPVRIVQAGDTDCCACCGVHVENTGEIGLVKLFSSVRFRSGSRIEMLSGQRALSRLNLIWQENARVSHAFSAKPEQTGQAAEKINETLAQVKYRLTGLENQLFSAIAQSHRGEEKVVLFHSGLDSGGVRRLAELIAREAVGTTAVFSGSDDTGYVYALAAAGQNASQLCKAMNSALSGRGGGRDGFFQGSVRAEREKIQRFFVENV